MHHSDLSLAHNNALAVLVNRVGLGGSSVGYADRGFDVTLADNATADIHFYEAFPYVLSSRGQLTGTWQPDGRSLDPMSPGLAFVTANRDNRLNIFEGADPNGVWTLFAADLSAGGLSTLDDWTLDISVVPEPAPTLLLLCGLAGIAARKLGSLAKSPLR